MKKLLLTLLLLTTCVCGAALAFRLTPPEKIVLENGLTVYSIQDTDLPKVSFEILVTGAGTADEPAAREGLADLSALLLTRGNRSLDAEKTAEELDFMGASLDTAATMEYATLFGSCLKEYFPRLMEITADCLFHPTFRQDEFDKEKARRTDEAQAVKDEAQEAVSAYFQKAYFGTHPFSHIREGTEISLPLLRAEDVRAFHAANYRPDRMILVVAGDVAPDQLRKVLADTLARGAKPATAAAAAPRPAPPAPKGIRVILVDKPDATQSYFILGAPGMAKGEPREAQVDVMNTLFGERFTSWLNTELRIKRGLTYGARSSFQARRDSGLFTISSYTRNDQIQTMLDITLDLMKKAREKGFTPEEVQSSRNYILGQFPPQVESARGKAEAFADMAFYHLGFDYLTRYLDGVRDTTPEQCREAAQRWIPAENYLLVVVGKGAEIRPLLEKYGKVEIRKISDPGF